MLTIIEWDRDRLGRMETGPVQFGDDWPGVFIRGDNAMGAAMGIASIIGFIEEHIESLPPTTLLYVQQLKNTQDLLMSATVRPTGKTEE